MTAENRAPGGTGGYEDAVGRVRQLLRTRPQVALASLAALNLGDHSLANVGVAKSESGRSEEALSYLGEIEATIEQSRTLGESLTLRLALFEKGLALDPLAAPAAEIAGSHFDPSIVDAFEACQTRIATAYAP